MELLSSEPRAVNADGGTINFTLERKKIKNINLRIRHDGNVYVSAPSKVDYDVIEKFVISKSDYIRKAIESFQCNLEPRSELEYVSGENVTLLGKNLRLSIEKSYSESVVYDGVYVHVKALRTDSAYKSNIMKLFNNWMNDFCNSVFEEVMHNVHKRFMPYGVKFPELRIREMTSRWGSCMPKRGIITLNKRLIEAPICCIEYVVFHEFCHFIHPNHSKDFYTLLQVMLPNWKETKAILEKSVNI